MVAIAVGDAADPTINSVTYNGVSMSSVSKVYSNGFTTAGYVEIFRLVGPATGANTVAVTLSGTADAISAGSTSFTGVDQTTPVGTPVTGSAAAAPATVTVNGTTAGNMVFDGICTGVGVTSSGQTQRWLRNTNTNTGGGNGASSTAAAGGSVAMSYTITSDWWGIAAVEVLAAAAAATVAPPALVADRGTVANAAAATTSTLTLSSPTTIAVGNYLITRVAVDNSGASGAAPGFTVTDPRSNTWTILGPALADPGAAAAGATAYIGYARVVTAYQAADALTLNWGGISTTAKACVLEEWSDISSVTPVAVAAVTNNSVAAASTTAVQLSIAPTAANQLVYTCLATEGIAGDTVGTDSDTTNGSWASLTTTASANATAAANQRVSGQYKVVTAAGAQSWDSTITSRDWAALTVVFNPPFSSPIFRPQLRRSPPFGALLDL